MLINGSAIRALPLDLDPLRPVRDYVTFDATVLVVALREPGNGTAVRVTVAGREPTTIPLHEIDASGVHATFEVFSELPPYTVELADDAGASLRLLAP